MNLKLSNNELVLRDITSLGDELLFAIYCSSRTDLLLMQDWPEQQKTHLLKQQFAAQNNHFKDHYTDANFWIIERNGEAIGRLFLQEKSDTVFGVDIAFLPSHRNNGLGSQILKDIIHYAKSVDKSFTFHVENINPAFRLYTRMGFKLKSNDGVYSLMEWKPNDGSTGFNGALFYSCIFFCNIIVLLT